MARCVAGANVSHDDKMMACFEPTADCGDRIAAKTEDEATAVCTVTGQLARREPAGAAISLDVAATGTIFAARTRAQGGGQKERQLAASTLLVPADAGADFRLANTTVRRLGQTCEIIREYVSLRRALMRLAAFSTSNTEAVYRAMVQSRRRCWTRPGRK